jgi:tRNA pseudouridine38-40 synthase
VALADDGPARRSLPNDIAPFEGPLGGSPAGAGRMAVGIAYDGGPWLGWQSQPGGRTVQDEVEAALSRFAGVDGCRLTTYCAGRTDAGVHALNQVVHFDAPVQREPFSWVRGTNRYLPPGIALQWCRPVSAAFHARYAAIGRRYAYLLLEAPVRPALETGRVGFSFRPLDAQPMQLAAQSLLGTHDFSAFRSAQCQARSPVKTLHRIRLKRRGAYWRFDFDGDAFLHHMVRNLMGCLVMVGQGARSPAWLQEVLASRNRALAAPTMAAAGLYFLGPYYDATHALPEHTPAFDWLPQA